MPPSTTILFFKSSWNVFNISFKKILIKKYYYYVKVYILKIHKYVAFSVKIVLSCFYATFKQWLQEVESPYMYFSLIKWIPNFYDLHIMYSK
jgi:hypothetical protein